MLSNAPYTIRLHPNCLLPGMALCIMAILLYLFYSTIAFGIASMLLFSGLIILLQQTLSVMTTQLVIGETTVDYYTFNWRAYHVTIPLEDLSVLYLEPMRWKLPWTTLHLKSPSCTLSMGPIKAPTQAIVRLQLARAPFKRTP